MFCLISFVFIIFSFQRDYVLQISISSFDESKLPAIKEYIAKVSQRFFFFFFSTHLFLFRLKEKDLLDFS